jgi:hypothetical protein
MKTHKVGKGRRRKKLGGWNTLGGGTSAFNPNHNSHSTRGDFGEYHVDPPTRRGGNWSLKWANTTGRKAPHGGLWHDLGGFRSANEAKAHAAEHEETTR